MADDRRFDDMAAEWRGAMEARVIALERRFESNETRAGVLGESIVGLRVDMSAVRQELRQVAKAVKDSSDQYRDERNDLVDDLKETLNQRKLNGFQLALAVGAPIVVAVISFLILSFLAGTPTVAH